MTKPLKEELQAWLEKLKQDTVGLLGLRLFQDERGLAALTPVREGVVDLSKKQKKRLLSSTSIHEVHTLLKTAFSYAVEWDLIHKIPLPRDAPKVNIEERTIWNEKTMLAALKTIENKPFNHEPRFHI